MSKSPSSGFSHLRPSVELANSRICVLQPLTQSPYQTFHTPFPSALSPSKLFVTGAGKVFVQAR